MGLAQNLKNLRNRRPKVAASPFPSKPYSSTNKKAIFDKSKNMFYLIIYQQECMIFRQ